MTHLVAITGVRHAPKTALAQALIDQLASGGHDVTLLDNGEVPFEVDSVTRQRLAGGCVCCSLAGSLLPVVWRLKSSYAILITSAMTDPEILDRLLKTFRGTHIHVKTFAVIDGDTVVRFSHLARKLHFYSTVVFDEPFDFSEVGNAIL